MKRIFALLIILLIAGGALYFAQRRHRHDAVSPDAVLDATADWQRDLTRAPMRVTRLSDAEETKIGDLLAHQYEAAQPPLTPRMRATARYVSQVGDRVAAHTRRRITFHFHLVPDPDLINAFALPGGHVFIGQGLIDQMGAEDELAFVLGHEIEHIDHYHAVERVQIEAQLHHFDLDVVAAIADIPMSLWQAGYSKEEEFEADREGLRLAVLSGYSAQGATALLNRFLELDRQYVSHAETPVEELSEVAIDGLKGYFRSHPETEERLAQAREVIAEDHLANVRLTPLGNEFKSHEQANR